MPTTSLASDLAARRAAAGLRWIEAGRSGDCVWGRCQGSAQRPYQVVALLGETPRTSCSCPSRRSPCKHAVGLMLRWSDDQLAEGAEPDFARQWRERLSAATPTRTRKPAADPDAAAEAARHRAAQRRDRVSGGLEELEHWLADQVRAGLAGMPRAGYAPVEAVAARMIDAQAPGVASMLRALPSALVGEQWPERALHQLGSLHLLAAAHARLDDLPPDLAATVRSRVGYPVAKADVLDSPGVADTWWALGAVDSVDYQLETRRVWLRGARTGRWAVWLTFAPPGQSLDTSVLPGSVLTAALHFYPGAGHRALIGEQYDWAPEPLRIGPAGEDQAEWTVRAARAALAATLAADPWASRMPVLVCGVPLPPTTRDADWRLRDADGSTCRLVDLTGEPWPVLARSAGRPLTVFGEWSGHGLLPLSVLDDVSDRVVDTDIYA